MAKSKKVTMMADADMVSESKKYRAVCDDCSYRGLWHGNEDNAYGDANQHRSDSRFQDHQMVVEEEKTFFARKLL